MNIEAVRAFVAVVEEGQFQLAADRLDVSQQAVSNGKNTACSTFHHAAARSVPIRRRRFPLESTCVW